MKTNRYIIVFVLVNLLFIAVYVFFNLKTVKTLNEINLQKDYVRSNEIIVFEIGKKLYRLENNILKLTVFGTEDNIVNYYLKKIKKEINEIKRLIKVLQTGGEYSQSLLVNTSYSEKFNKTLKIEKKYFDVGLLDVVAKLKIVDEELNELLVLIKQRNNKIEKNTALRLKRFLKLMPSLFDRMAENTNRYLVKTDSTLRELECKKEKLLKKYFNIQIVFLIFTFFINISILFYLLKSFNRLYEELEYRLYHDNLTKLKNRLALEEDLKHYKSKTKKGLILIDIEGFSNINELYGVEIGNEYLVSFSQMLKKLLPEENVYRVGSDEFAVLLIDKPDIKKHAKRLYKEIVNQKIYVPSLDISIDIDVKMGLAVKVNLLRNAILALQFAKQKNLPVYKILKKDIIEANEKIKESMYWSREIKKALKEDNFVPFFQPIVDRDGHIVKYEVLMRMKNGEHYVPPVFLDIAIKNMQYINISKNLFLKIVEILKHKNINVSFNINFLDIENFEMRNLILKTLKQYPEIAKKITFEILENLEIQEYELLESFIEESKSLGSRFAIDDFGSGFSNYKRVLDMKTDFLKIDGSLIKNIHEDRHSYNIVKSVALFAKESNIKTVAEFVHCKEVFEVCKELDIDYFQGYYFSPPLKDI